MKKLPGVSSALLLVQKIFFQNHTKINFCSIFSNLSSGEVEDTLLEVCKAFLSSKQDNLLTNSFFPSTIIEWNNLDQEAKAVSIFLETISRNLSGHLLIAFNSHNPK